MQERRKWGTRVQPKTLGWEVELESKQRFEAIAKRMGLSYSVFFEQVVEHLELTDQGIPPWAPPLDRDGELPIDSP